MKEELKQLIRDIDIRNVLKSEYLEENESKAWSCKYCKAFNIGYSDCCHYCRIYK